MDYITYLLLFGCTSLPIMCLYLLLRIYCISIHSQNNTRYRSRMTVINNHLRTLNTLNTNLFREQIFNRLKSLDPVIYASLNNVKQTLEMAELPYDAYHGGRGGQYGAVSTIKLIRADLLRMVGVID